MSRHNRRSTRPLLDLPSLFDAEPSSALSQIKIDIPEQAPQPSVLDDYSLGAEYSQPRHQLRFISFGSGSSGNCSYVGTPETGLIIDAGVDNNRVLEELRRCGVDISTIKGILLTHDHGDHVRYAYALVRRHPWMKIFCTLRTLEGILRRHNLSRRIKDYHSPIFKEHEYRFDDIVVTPFETSHDGTDNVGYHIALGHTHMVVATDMGKITERADHYMRQATSLMIESNYDDKMLENGPYPLYLRARIRSERGHLDNAVAAQYIATIRSEKLRHVFLCHLSHDNNTPEVAMKAVADALKTQDIQIAQTPTYEAPSHLFVTPLPRFTSSDLFIL